MAGRDGLFERQPNRSPASAHIKIQEATMKLLSLVALAATLAAIENAPKCSAQSISSTRKTIRLEEHRMDPLAGKTIKWRFVDGPMAGTSYAHTFSQDGSVTWRIADGERKGATAREKSYAAVKVNERTVAV